jgi:hypothetical protein
MRSGPPGDQVFKAVIDELSDVKPDDAEREALTRAKSTEFVSLPKTSALGTRSARDNISGTSDRKVGTATQRLRGIRRKWMDPLAKASSGRSRPRRFELLVRSRPLPPRAHGCRARA